MDALALWTATQKALTRIAESPAALSALAVGAAVLAAIFVVPGLRRRYAGTVQTLFAMLLLGGGGLYMVMAIKGKPEAVATTAERREAADPAGKGAAAAKGDPNLLQRWIRIGADERRHADIKRATKPVVVAIVQGGDELRKQRDAIEAAWLKGYAALKKRRYAEGRGFLEEARSEAAKLPKREPEDRRAEGHALAGLARAARETGNNREALQAYGAARASFLAAGDESGRRSAAAAAIEVAEIRGDIGQAEAARAAFKEALAEHDVPRASADEVALRAAAAADERYGKFEREQGQAEAAAKALDRAGATYAKLRSAADMARIQVARAEAALAEGRFTEARALIEAARLTFAEERSPDDDANAVFMLARIETAARRDAEALALLEELHEFYRGRADRAGEQRTLAAKAALHYRMAKIEAGRKALAEAEAIAAALQDRPGRALVAAERGRLEAEHGDREAAIRAYAGAQREFQAMDRAPAALLAARRAAALCLELPEASASAGPREAAAATPPILDLCRSFVDGAPAAAPKRAMMGRN